MMKRSLFALAAASALSVVPSHPAAAAVGAPQPPSEWAEDFSTDPLTHGWRVLGDPSLFEWDAPQHRLAVTWDSRQTNSYFACPLGTVLAKNDDFRLGFDLRLNEVRVGIDTNKPYTFQLAVGLIQLSQATNVGWFRGVGVATNGPRNLVEFTYFPDSGFGATVSPTLVSSNNEYASSFNYPVELALGDLFHVEMAYTASNRTLVTAMMRNGAPFGPIEDAVLDAAFSDFRVDHVAVCSYNDGGQDPEWDGSVLAHGSVDNVTVTVPPPPVRNLGGAMTNGHWQVCFDCPTNWHFTLERSTRFQSWTPVSPAVPSVASPVTLQDTNSVLEAAAFYRVRAERP